MDKNTNRRMFKITFAMAILTTCIVACGGGGGDAGFNPPPGGGNTPWQAGVFMPASTFAASCAAPRSGTNPATGQAFPDVQGATVDENNFLRSFSDNTYLWYSEIVDQDPGTFSDTLDYFDVLRTTAITPSGQDKDKFHFTFDSEEWFQLSQSGVSAGYGAQWVLLTSLPPREAVVAYTEPNSPATAPAANLARGARLITIDGVDVANGSDVATLNAGLFPESIGETHTFVVQDLGSPTTRTISLTSAAITSAPVQNTQVIDTATGRVGYLLFNDHIATAEDGLIDAVNQLNSGQGIVDLVLDIRYNGGGFLAIAAQMAYMIAGDTQAAGRDFETLQFNDKHPVTNPITGQAITPTPFYDETLGFGNRPAGQALPTLNLSRLFVLTGAGTCSASEAIMNGLRGIDVEVIQIGSTTCGKPYGFFPQDNCGTTFFTIQFRGVNSRDFGDYTDGFSPQNTQSNIGVSVPGCAVADDFNAALGSITEDRLAAALAYRENPNCPVVANTSIGNANAAAERSRQTALSVPKSPWHTNRIYQD